MQQAVVTVLNQIYETDFLGFSYGFRPGRGQHDALDALNVAIMERKVNWVLELDSSFPANSDVFFGFFITKRELPHISLIRFPVCRHASKPKYPLSGKKTICSGYWQQLIAVTLPESGIMTSFC